MGLSMRTSALARSAPPKQRPKRSGLATVGKRPWREATVKTLLNRLLKKQAITATKEGVVIRAT